MPAIITHDLFGRDVLGDASDLLGFTAPDEKDAFLLGNQGPDPLFYTVVDPLMHRWTPLGGVMHRARPAALLLAMREAVERLEGHERRVARAYMAGFACHWQLDSTMHPFVYFWQNGICSAGVPGLDEGAGSKVHAEIERDLDEMVLFSVTGRTVAQARPHEHALAASRAVLAAVDKLYSYVALWVYGRPIDPRAFTVAVEDFRLVQRVFDSPSGRRRAVLGGVERLVTGEPFSLVNAMSHRVRAEKTSDFDNRERGPWENPFTHEVSRESFWDLWNRARVAAPATISGLLLGKLDLDDVRALTRDVNFEGDTSAPDAPFTW